MHTSVRCAPETLAVGPLRDVPRFTCGSGHLIEALSVVVTLPSAHCREGDTHMLLPTQHAAHCRLVRFVWFRIEVGPLAGRLHTCAGLLLCVCGAATRRALHMGHARSLASSWSDTVDNIRRLRFPRLQSSGEVGTSRFLTRALTRLNQPWTTRTHLTRSGSVTRALAHTQPTQGTHNATGRARGGYTWGLAQGAV